MIKVLYNIRTMAKLNVRTDIIDIFYYFSIGGVLQYCFAAWCGNATKANLERIGSIIRKASNVIRIRHPNIDSIYKVSLGIKLNMVWGQIPNTPSIFTFMITLFHEIQADYASHQ